MSSLIEDWYGDYGRDVNFREFLRGHESLRLISDENIRDGIDILTVVLNVLRLSCSFPEKISILE